MVIFVSSVWSLVAIVAGPVPTSMRKRVEFPVGFDLAPAMSKAIRLEHQKRDDNQSDPYLAQKGDVGIERQGLVDGTAPETGTDPLHRFRQQHHKGGSHQR